MQPIRHFLAQRHWAVLVCTLALFVKLLVPTGYMIANDHGRIAITICAGVEPALMMDGMAGMHGSADGDGSPIKPDKAELPCAFAGMAAAALGSVDPVQLAELTAFLLAIGLAVATVPTPKRPSYLRPPLRGPPIHL